MNRPPRYHVIASRESGVAIPSIFRVVLVPRDCHVAWRLLAMTWYFPMPFGIGGRFMNRPYAPKQKRRVPPHWGGRDVEDAVPYGKQRRKP